MPAEAGDTSDDSPMIGSYPLSNRFPQYGRANGVLLTKIIDAMVFTCFNINYVVVVIGIETWTHVYPAFIRMCVLLTSEHRFVRNALYWLRNLVIPAPANTYHDAVRFLRDTAPDGDTNLPIPSFYDGYVWHRGRSWEVFHEGKHTFAFRPLSSLYSVNNISPLALYDVVIRNMFFYQHGGKTIRLVKKICDILKSVNYDPLIALYVPDNDTHVIIHEALPILPNLVERIPEGRNADQVLSSIASIELEEQFSSVPRQVIKSDEFTFAFDVPDDSESMGEIQSPHSHPSDDSEAMERIHSGYSDGYNGSGNWVAEVIHSGSSDHSKNSDESEGETLEIPRSESTPERIHSGYSDGYNGSGNWVAEVIRSGSDHSNGSDESEGETLKIP